MGNKHSLGCCIYASPQPQRKSHDASTRSVLESEPCRAESTANLQHISEREPEDWHSDPSLHPKTETIFMERSRAAINGKYTYPNSMLSDTFLSLLALVYFRGFRTSEKPPSG